MTGTNLRAIGIALNGVTGRMGYRHPLWPWVPVVVLFAFIERFLVSGLTAGSVKG